MTHLSSGSLYLHGFFETSVFYRVLQFCSPSFPFSMVPPSTTRCSLQRGQSKHPSLFGKHQLFTWIQLLSLNGYACHNIIWISKLLSSSLSIGLKTYAYPHYFYAFRMYPFSLSLALENSSRSFFTPFGDHSIHILTSCSPSVNGWLVYVELSPCCQYSFQDLSQTGTQSYIIVICHLKSFYRIQMHTLLCSAFDPLFKLSPSDGLPVWILHSTIQNIVPGNLFWFPQ